MPQIAQQDYKIIAPKPERAFVYDAAALGELKKAILNGTAFDCLIKDLESDRRTIDCVLGHYEPGYNTKRVLLSDVGNDEVRAIDLPYTPEQYSGLAAVQEAADQVAGRATVFPVITADAELDYLYLDNEELFICIGGKYLAHSTDANDRLESIYIADSGPEGDFINITWEDAQKLIGLPIA